MATMRAVRVEAFGGVEHLKLKTDVPRPVPGEGEVLIEVMAAGVNPFDTYIRSGAYDAHKTLPFTTGQDAAGVIVEVGKGVTKFKKGDRVFVVDAESGSYAEFATANVKDVTILADDLTFEQGASIGIPYYSAYKALYTLAKSTPSDTVLVHGASGGVGVGAVQMAKAKGHYVIGTAGTPQGLDLVKRLGADAVFNHREEGYMQKIKKLTGDKGVDVVLDMLANVNLVADLQILADRGRIVIVGSRGEVSFNPSMTMGKESSIIGISLPLVKGNEWEEILAGVEEGQRSGWLKPVVGRVYPLSEAHVAQHDVIHNSGTLGKLIIDVTK